MTRRKHDFYPTPQRLVSRCLDALVPCVGAEVIGGRVLEPSAGAGIWCAEVRRRAPDADITAVDIQTDGLIAAAGYRRDLVSANRWLIRDFLTVSETDSPEGDGWDLALGNPPYGDAERHVTHALTLSRWVAFILPLPFLASRSRYATMYGPAAALRPRVVWILPDRPSFTGDGKTDGCDYGLFLWWASSLGRTEIRWLEPDKKGVIGESEEVPF